MFKKDVVTKNGNELAKVKISRENGELTFYIKASEEIENLFKNDNVTDSSVYRSNGNRLKYYKLDDKVYQDFHRLEQRHNVVLNHYGSNLMEGGIPNFSILRTVGISNNSGIKLKLTGLISSESIKKYIDDMKKFLKTFYREYVNDVSITMTLKLREA